MNRWQEITKKTLRLLLPAVFLLPLVVLSDYYFPFIVPRNILFRLIIGLSLGGFLMLFLANPREYLFIFKHKLILAYVVFVGLLTFSSLINGDFLYSFWSTYERMDGLITFYFLLVFLLLMVGIFRNEESFFKLFRFTLFISFVVAFVALGQNLGEPLLLQSSYGARISSTLGNATYLGAYALFHFFFALYLALKNSRSSLKQELLLFVILDALILITTYKTGIIKTIFTNAALSILFVLPQLIVIAGYYFKEKYARLSNFAYFIIVAVLNLFALINTQTRGAFVGLIIGMAAMFFVSVFLMKNAVRLRKAAILFIVLLILFSGSIFYFKDSAIIQNIPTLKRMSTISFDDTTVKSRFLTWGASYKGWLEKPILGYGEEKFYVVFNKYFPQQIYRHSGSRVWFDRPHNAFLQPLIHGGILGFVAYLAVFLFAFLSLFRYWKIKKDAVPLVVFGGLIIAYMVQNAFVFDSLNSFILIFLLYAYIIFITRVPVSEEERGAARPLLRKPPFLLLILVVVATYFITIPKLGVNKSFVEAYTIFKEDAGNKSERMIDSAKKIQEIIDKQYLGSFELSHTFSDDVSRIVTRKELPENLRLELGKIAEEEMLNTIKAQPDNARHYSFLTMIYMNLIPLDESYAEKNLDLLEKAIELSPTRTHLYYSQGRSYISTLEYDKAIDSFTYAVELSPKVFDAHINLIAGLLGVGRADDALAHIEMVPANLERALTPEEYKKIAEIFASFRHLEKAIILIEKNIEEYPDFIDSYKALSVYYAGIGEREKALSSAKKLLELDPSLQDDFDEFKLMLEQAEE